MAKWVACQQCHGNGVEQVEVKPGKWETVPCRARCNNGKVNTGLI